MPESHSVVPRFGSGRITAPRDIEGIRCDEDLPVELGVEIDDPVERGGGGLHCHDRLHTLGHAIRVGEVTHELEEKLRPRAEMQVHRLARDTGGGCDLLEPRGCARLALEQTARSLENQLACGLWLPT